MSSGCMNVVAFLGHKRRGSRLFGLAGLEVEICELDRAPSSPPHVPLCQISSESIASGDVLGEREQWAPPLNVEVTSLVPGHTTPL